MPPALLALAPAIASAAGGIIGNAASAGDRANALATQQQALQALQNVNTPTADQLKLALAKYQSAGQLNPNMETDVNQGPSAMNNINLDPRLQQAQMNALSQMQQLGSSGLRPQDVAALNQVNNTASRNQNAANQSIMQNMQMQGLGGSGARLAQQLANSQNSANNANMQGLNIAGQASQNALQAIMNSGSLGGQISGQQFGQQSQVANANDVINHYNTLNQQQVGNQNVAIGNSAQATNLQNAQQLNNMNTGVANQQAMYNAQLPQMVYQDQMGKAQAAINPSNGMANTYNNLAGQQQSMYGNIGQAVGQGVAGVNAYNTNQANQTKQDARWNDYMSVLKGKQNSSPTIDQNSANGGDV